MSNLKAQTWLSEKLRLDFRALCGMPGTWTQMSLTSTSIGSPQNFCSKLAESWKM